MLSEICEIKYGKDLSLKNISAKEKYPVFGANGIIGYHNDYMYEEEQVLISCRGTYSGKINLSPRKCHVTHNSLILEFKKELQKEKKYFYYAFQNLDKSKFVTGSTQPQVTIANANNIEVYFAPLNEQKRIVAKLDKLLTKVETAKERLDKIPQTLKRFRQSVLSAAVSGELTKVWREKKSIMDWYNAIAQIHNQREVSYQKLIELSKRQKLIKPPKPNYLNYSFLDNINHDANLPNTWVKATVGFLCDCIVPGRDKPKSFTGKIPWITLPDLDSESITVNRSGLGLSISEIKKVKGKIIPKNSVIMSCIGRFGISSVVENEIVINQQLHAFLESPIVIPKYIVRQAAMEDV
ncbi:MAG: restriction endonuclease subunit S [Bacteroidetes bacterium]|nr:restriction endonuclease subunit S [Bacteroidota bacterium]MBU2584512.1 restriction endonuclease subunit S [Bacteroidota bacterium]